MDVEMKGLDYHNMISSEEADLAPDGSISMCFVRKYKKYHVDLRDLKRGELLINDTNNPNYKGRILIFIELFEGVSEHIDTALFIDREYVTITLFDTKRERLYHIPVESTKTRVFLRRIEELPES